MSSSRNSPKASARFAGVRGTLSNPNLMDKGFSEALGLYHGGLCSARRVGCVFQFEGDNQGVIALSPLFPGPNSDLFRYTLVLAAPVERVATFSSRGGTA